MYHISSKTKIATAVLTSVLSFSAIAEQNSHENKSETQIKAYFDMYYQISPQAHQAAPAPANGPFVVEGRYFDRHHQQMTLSMAEISVLREKENFKYKLDLAVGEMVDQLSGGGSQSVAGANTVNQAANEPTRYLTQAYVTYAAAPNLTLTAGKFYTPMGFEVTKSKDNWQYSRGLLFNYAIPFWHQGAIATYSAIPEKLNLNLYVVNAWDGRISQETNKSTSIVAGFNWLGTQGLVVNYNYYAGVDINAQDARQVHEINASYEVNPTVSWALDYVIGQQQIPNAQMAKYNALALYLKAKIDSANSISARYEIFDDSDSGIAIAGGLSAAGTQQKINTATLTYSNLLSSEAELRLEARSDKSDSNAFFKDKDGLVSDHQESGSVSILYAF